MAFLLLIRCTKGENWEKIMDELSIDNSISVERYSPNGTLYFEYCRDE